MTIEKPYYEAPHGTEPGYIDPKELMDIFKQLQVSEMVKVTPSQFEYMMQRYNEYLNSPGDTSLSFKDYVKEFFEQQLKKGGLVK